MTRVLLVLVVLAAVAGIAVLLLGGEGGGILGDTVERSPEEEYVPPELRGNAPDESWRNPTERREPPREEPPPPGPGAASGEGVYLSGLVLDAATSHPLADAVVWIETHREPCPTPGHAPGFKGTARSDEGGRFALRARPEETPSSGSIDLFVIRKGYVAAVLCAPALPGEATLRLEKGLVLGGRVHALNGQAVQGAAVRARPGPETPATPGHGTMGPTPVTDEEGRFLLDGLLPGALLVDVDHGRYMPQTVGPWDPADGKALEITLVPALRATFKIRTDDGRDPQNPTLVWRTVEATPRSEVLLLRVMSSWAADGEDGTVEGEVTTEPVRLPCDAPSVMLEIKADGYATWRSEPKRLPREGGEETFEVKLVGDLGTGSAKIALEDEGGEKVNAALAGVQVDLQPLTPGTGGSTYVLQSREDLRITDLPAGRYRVRMLSARFAPAETDITVEVGREAESLVRVRPPAKVKVKFLADEQTLVRFRLTQGGEVVHGVPEGTFSRGTDEKTGEPILTAGADGLILSGLASGTYTVEVLSEELSAPPTVVHLVEGDTAEVEITVRPR